MDSHQPNSVGVYIAIKRISYFSGGPRVYPQSFRELIDSTRPAGTPLVPGPDLGRLLQENQVLVVSGGTGSGH